MEKTYKVSLAAARKNANLTQEQVAKMLGRCKQTVINWEKGKTPIGIPEFAMLCEIYKIPVECIFLPYNSTNSRSENKK